MQSNILTTESIMIKSPGLFRNYGNFIKVITIVLLKMNKIGAVACYILILYII